MIKVPAYYIHPLKHIFVPIQAWWLHSYYTEVSLNSFKKKNIVKHACTLQVMLMSCPSIEDLYHKSCALAEDPPEVQEGFVHPTRLIHFLVGLKGKNETMAIGGPWSPSLDGANPRDDPQVLIRTAIRTTKALTGIDLTRCTQW